MHRSQCDSSKSRDAQKLQQIATFMLGSEFLQQQQHASRDLHPTMTKFCKSGSQTLKLQNVYFVQGKGNDDS